LFFYVFARDPQMMVRLGGIAQAATLPMIAVATLFFRFRRLDSRLRPPVLVDVLLLTGVMSICVVATYTLWGTLTR
jgi:hypothetical protein